MKILVTNDDGIAAPGLAALVRWASGIGEVTVSAPKTEQSGKSHSINLTTSFEIKEVYFPGAARAYSVDSTPADCVRFGILGLEGDYDMVLSGVNRGFNLGGDIVYSGTAGAVFEAAYFGIRALAFSTDFSTHDAAEASLDRVYGYICCNRLFDHCRLYNVNIPLDPGEILLTRQGGPYYRDVFVEHGGGMYRPKGRCVHQNLHDHTVDADAVSDGFISVTPLTISRTDSEAYDALSRLSLLQ
ncbi:MAG: 5'/3'-nucleotidase SurE [Eubacteriales bacterium]|nr:5'/3'-nucleotidase SurE [Eubacteriales bacterium]